MLPQTADYMRLLPEIVLAVFGMIVMVVDAAAEQRRRAVAGLQEVVACRASLEQIPTLAGGTPEYGITARTAEDGGRAASHEEQTAGVAVHHVVGTDRVNGLAAAACQDGVRPGGGDVIAAAAKLQDAMT